MNDCDSKRAGFQRQEHIRIQCTILAKPDQRASNANAVKEGKPMPATKLVVCGVDVDERVKRPSLAARAGAGHDHARTWLQAPPAILRNFGL